LTPCLYPRRHGHSNGSWSKCGWGCSLIQNHVCIIVSTCICEPVIHWEHCLEISFQVIGESSWGILDMNRNC
jgi:hypothetical protein